MNTIQDLLILPKSGRYSSPETTSDILPTIYGDMTENSGDLGVWACPQIDTEASVYALAGHALATLSGVRLFDDDGEIDASEYTLNRTHNYESQGVITTATFTTAPTGAVSAQGKGKAGSTGDVLTNPIDIIEDIFSTALDNIFFPSALYAAKYAATTAGYTCAGVMVSDNTYAYWISAILSNFIGDWWITNVGEIAMRLDTSSTTPQISAILREREAEISGTVSLQNICNQIQANYAVSYAQQDKRYKSDVRTNYLKTDDGDATKDSFSQARYGIRIKEMNFDWIRNAATIEAIQTHLVTRSKSPTWIISWREIGFQSIQAEVGDFVLYSWHERLNDDGEPYINQYAQVLNQDIDLDGFTITYQLRGTDDYLQEVPEIWDGTPTVGDGGTFGGNRDTNHYS